MTVAEETAVIERVLVGETDAFETLVLANQNKVYTLALKMTGSEEDAFDMSQEAFVKAFASLKNFRAESRFSVWLYRLTYNICIDFIRKKKRTPTVSLTYKDRDGDYMDMQIPDSRFVPETEAEKHELREAVEKGINALPEKHREILVMRELSGLSYDEIAQTLGINEGTVKSRLSRARRSLVALLNGNGTFSKSNRHTTSKEVEPHG